MMNIKPVIFLIIDSGINLNKKDPKYAPIKLSKDKANDAPKNTINGTFVRAERDTTANWVLSPSSAKKIVEKVNKKTYKFFINRPPSF